MAAFFLFLETSWDLPRHHVFLSSILLGKTWKNRGFWHPQTLPKLPPKPFKIDVQKTNRFFLFFERCSFKFETFETLKISIFPGENHYFSGFCKNVFSPFEQFVSAKNRRKNHEKSRPNHEKIESEIHLFFNIDFLAFWAPFWKVLGASWASLGKPWASKMWPKRVAIIEGEQFFSTFVVFVARLSFFFDLGGLGERLGGFFGGLGKDFCQGLKNFAIIFTSIFTTFIVFVARLC